MHLVMFAHATYTNVLAAAFMQVQYEAAWNNPEAVAEREAAAVAAAAEAAAAEGPLHEENDWGIEVVSVQHCTH